MKNIKNRRYLGFVISCIALANLLGANNVTNNMKFITVTAIDSEKAKENKMLSVVENVKEITGQPYEIYAQPAIQSENILLEDNVYINEDVDVSEDINENDVEMIEENNKELEPLPITNEFNPYTDIFSYSGLSAERIREIIESYAFEDIAEEIYSIENEYRINSYFTISVACLESGYGKSNMAKDKNNLFGLMGMKFNSQSECVRYFGELIVSYIDKGIAPNVSAINVKYCESSEWTYKIVNLMNKFGKL